jgi:nucleotide-binding universal stress UspA family protein
MSAKIIVSYDGTANENDAVALGGIFARAGADVSLAYVRHIPETDPERESQAQREAQELLERGVAQLGDAAKSQVGRHVITDRSTPEGLRALAEVHGADVIVFCSDSHTAKGHVTIGNSAQRLLEGGRTAIAIAPAGLADASHVINTVVAVGEPRGDGSAESTARVLAGALGATVAPVVGSDVDLVVVGSRGDVQQGRVGLSSAATHLIENATSAVLVVPNGVTLPFGATAPSLVA